MRDMRKNIYVMRDMRKNIYVMRDMRKNIYVMRDMRKNIYVMRERGYLPRTSRPRNAFSPPHPLRWKTGNAFSPQTYKLADYQQFI
jgi:hypothetical protein